MADEHAKGEHKPDDKATHAKAGDAPKQTETPLGKPAKAETPKADGPREQARAANRARMAGAPVPDAAEMKELLEKKFGKDGGGSIRVDAQPAGSGPDAPPTKLVYVNAAGVVVGTEDYSPKSEG